MAFFKKKNQTNEEKPAEKGVELKDLILAAVNEKLNGTIYDGCIIMRGGYMIDVNIGREDEKEGIKLVQAVFIVRNDNLFDEPLIDPVDAQGQTAEEAANMAAQIFIGSVWHPLDMAEQRKNPQHISVDYLMQHYDFDMYSQSVIRIGVPEDRKPVLLVGGIKNDLAKYLGSKKYYWIRIYLAKLGDRQIIEVRVNGSVCTELAKNYREYVNSWEHSDKFICEKQYAICVQRDDDKCPFNKETVVNTAKVALDLMPKIRNNEDYQEMCEKLEEVAGDKALAAEIRIFIPEIFAKFTLGYKEGDSLFFIDKDDASIEFRKTQLRSYFYLQQTILEYLGTKPPKEDVQRIVINSVAYKELVKAKEKGLEPKDLYVPGTSFKIAVDDYKVW